MASIFCSRSNATSFRMRTISGSRFRSSMASSLVRPGAGDTGCGCSCFIPVVARDGWSLPSFSCRLSTMGLQGRRFPKPSIRSRATLFLLFLGGIRTITGFQRWRLVLNAHRHQISTSDHFHPPPVRVPAWPDRLRGVTPSLVAMICSIISQGSFRAPSPFPRADPAASSPPQ